MPLQKLENSVNHVCFADCLPGTSGRVGARRPELDQPLMVVVLVEVERTVAPALNAGAKFRLNVGAKNMHRIVAEAFWRLPYKALI
jgi:hypothetical protein